MVYSTFYQLQSVFMLSSHQSWDLRMTSDLRIDSRARKIPSDATALKVHPRSQDRHRGLACRDLGTPKELGDQTYPLVSYTLCIRAIQLFFVGYS